MKSNFLKKVLQRISTSINLGKKKSILIYQPGKVGSLTVQASLEEAYAKLNQRVEIHHVHALNHLDEREKFVKSTRANPKDSLNLIAEWKKLKQEIDQDQKKSWDIINLVRDPVAMKVSALFHLLYQHIPDWEARLKNGSLEMSEIDTLFFSKKEFGFSGLDTWYDKQIKELWGFDVYSEPFPWKKGYSIYLQGNIRLLIIRLEDLNQVAAQAFNEFLNLEEFKVVNTNVGDEKSYAEVYNAFKKRPLPEKYVLQGYETRFAKHFYSNVEIQNFRNQWLKQK